MKVNPWAIEALNERGITVNKDGSLTIEFHKGKLQKVQDLATAIRQQKHIIDQQQDEQKENEELGMQVKEFNDVVALLKNMSMNEFTEKRKDKTLKILMIKLEILAKKKNQLRVEAHQKLVNVFRMLDENNVPAAIWAADAYLNRLRKRWLVNEKVVDKSLARLTALENLKG
jgi:hypothetical protein